MENFITFKTNICDLMRIFFLDLLLLQEGKIFQLSSMLKLPHVGNKLKGRILLLKPYLEDHSSRLQMIILGIIKMLFIIAFFEYTFVELCNKLFKKYIFFLTSIMIHSFFWWPFPWADFFFVYLCLLGLGELAFATLFSGLCGSLFLALPKLRIVCI